MLSEEKKSIRVLVPLIPLKVLGTSFNNKSNTHVIFSSSRNSFKLIVLFDPNLVKYL